MADLDRFESQLAAAVKRFADGARTEVDAMAVATQAAKGGRIAGNDWFGRTVTVPIALLLLLGLLVLLTVSLAVGGWPFRLSIVPVAPTASTAAGLATIAPLPTADAAGVVHVSGTETISLPAFGARTVVGDVIQLRGNSVSVTTSANDPRVTGTGTFAFSVDIVDVARGTGVEWGTYHLETAGGAWEGPCSGSTWDGGATSIGGCWLTGSGAFAGFTYYRGYSWIPGRVWVEGIIYPGPPPQP